MNAGKSTKQPMLRGLIFEQTRTNDNINKKHAANDKNLEDIYDKNEYHLI